MAGLIATVVCVVVTLVLFRLDRERKGGTTKALWVPLMWLFVAASRNVSAWLQWSSSGASDYLDGSPLDRTVLSTILALGVIVAIRRRHRIAVLLRSNAPILLFFFYCGVSVLWSDYPDVAFKRWFRALGDVVMILVVLSEPDWLDAFKRLIARLGFLLLPLSILFIRYYPDLGRVYTRGGKPFWVGVTTEKNALGMLCLIVGLASIFRFIVIYRGEEGARKKAPLIAHGALILMASYLLRAADSATASSCFFMAGGVMVLTCLFRVARKPAIVNVMVGAVLAISTSALFLGLGTGMVEDLGRNSTLTGRTTIWHFALGMVNNPLLGTGFESFWLGPRLRNMIVLIDQTVNQAHNGYIEIYLNLGWVGVALLAVLIFSGYRRVLPAVRRQTQGGSLRLAYCIVAVAYNFTEAGFKMMHPVWIVFLLSIAVIPNRVRKPQKIGALDSSLVAAPATVRNETIPQRTSPDFVTPLRQFISV
jgi:exopolysaccharide production protein ExoQ